MAVFVNLEAEDSDAPQDAKPQWHGPVDAVKPLPVTTASLSLLGERVTNSTNNAVGKQYEEAHEPATGEDLNRNSMTQALGCYP